MKYLLDTNTCINYLNGKSERLKQKFVSQNPKTISLCSIVKAELYFGAYKSNFPEKNIIKVKQFLNYFNSYPFDDNSADYYGRIRNQLEKIGKPIGPNDLFIASIALANDAILVTHNTREFERVEGLKIVDWE